MAARTRRIALAEDTRLKIKAAMLINRLTNHATGDIELSATQVRAIEVLLKKVLPDLQAIEVDADVNVNHEKALDELARAVTPSNSEG